MLDRARLGSGNAEGWKEAQAIEEEIERHFRIGGGNAEGWKEAQATGEERERLLGISQFTRRLVDEYDDPKWCHVDCCTILGIISTILPWGAAATAGYFATIGILSAVNPLSTAIIAAIAACFALTILALIATVAIIKKII